MTEIAKELAKISKAYTEFCIAHSGAVPKGCACESCLLRHLPCLAAADSDEVSEYDWLNALEILKEFKEERK